MASSTWILTPSSLALISYCSFPFLLQQIWFIPGEQETFANQGLLHQKGPWKRQWWLSLCLQVGFQQEYFAGLNPRWETEQGRLSVWECKWWYIYNISSPRPYNDFLSADARKKTYKNTISYRSKKPRHCFQKWICFRGCYYFSCVWCIYSDRENQLNSRIMQGVQTHVTPKLLTGCKDLSIFSCSLNAKNKKSSTPKNPKLPLNVSPPHFDTMQKRCRTNLWARFWNELLKTFADNNL